MVRRGTATPWSSVQIRQSPLKAPRDWSFFISYPQHLWYFFDRIIAKVVILWSYPSPSPATSHGWVACCTVCNSSWMVAEETLFYDKKGIGMIFIILMRTGTSATMAASTVGRFSSFRWMKFGFLPAWRGTWTGNGIWSGDQDESWTGWMCT